MFNWFSSNTKKYIIVFLAGAQISGVQVGRGEDAEAIIGNPQDVISYIPRHQADFSGTDLKDPSTTIKTIHEKRFSTTVRGTYQFNFSDDFDNKEGPLHGTQLVSNVEDTLRVQLRKQLVRFAKKLRREYKKQGINVKQNAFSLRNIQGLIGNAVRIKDADITVNLIGSSCPLVHKSYGAKEATELNEHLAKLRAQNAEELIFTGLQSALNKELGSRADTMLQDAETNIAGKITYDTEGMHNVLETFTASLSGRQRRAVLRGEPRALRVFRKLYSDSPHRLDMQDALQDARYVTVVVVVNIDFALDALVISTPKTDDAVLPHQRQLNSLAETTKEVASTIRGSQRFKDVPSKNLPRYEAGKYSKKDRSKQPTKAQKDTRGRF